MNTSKKIITDYEELKKIREAHKSLGNKIICTIGSWDMLHIGHLRYLMKCKEQGDILIVGTDSDRGIKSYKGSHRPIIPESERMEMLSYQNCVDYVTIIDDIDENGTWGYDLIRVINPDAFVCIHESYPEQQRNEIKEFVVELIELPRQAENTSTSDIIQKTFKKHIGQIHDFMDNLKI